MKNWKRAVSLLVLAALALGLVMVAAAADPLPFTDLDPSADYHDEVRFVYTEGLMNGTGDGKTFSPAMTATRAMFAATLHRLDGENLVVGPDYSDVAEDAWYADAAAWLGWAELWTAEDGLFAPNGALTREDAVLALYRYAQYKNLPPYQYTNLTKYADHADVAADCADAMSWAMAAGLLDAVNGLLAPGAAMDRAALAVLISDFCDLLDLPEPEYVEASSSANPSGIVPPVPAPENSGSPYDDLPPIIHNTFTETTG